MHSNQQQLSEFDARFKTRKSTVIPQLVEVRNLNSAEQVMHEIAIESVKSAHRLPGARARINLVRIDL
jgi:putative IMPACT (imprinted ancient) family translation regulator